MPKELINKVKHEYEKKGKSAKEAENIAYATMNSKGYMRGGKETAKGRAAERKHEMHIHGGSDHEVIEMADQSEVREINMHQYGPEWRNTAAMRIIKVTKDYDSDEIVPNSWDFDEDGDESEDVHGAGGPMPFKGPGGLE